MSKKKTLKKKKKFLNAKMATKKSKKKKASKKFSFLSKLQKVNQKRKKQSNKVKPKKKTQVRKVRARKVPGLGQRLTRAKIISEKEREEQEELLKKFDLRILRGMQDILPEKMRYWDHVIKKIVELSESYGFKKIMLPIIEKRELFERATGITTDVVEKQMYQFRDRAGNQVVLRPEFTPGVARAYIEHGMFSLPQPVKLFYFGPLFRYERPQAGRYRQFYQFGLEVIGSEKSVIDAQLILFSQTLFNNLDLKINIQVNSLGCLECRKPYRSKLVSYFKHKRRWLCPDCHRRLIKNPLRILDCQKGSCQKLIQRAPQLVDSLCDDCQDHFVKTLEYLDEANVVYSLNPYLVRGLDYYTRTVFELWPDRSQTDKKNNNLFGSQSALGGGGRYDNLIEGLGGRSTPASGLACGIERIVEEIKIQKVKVPKVRPPQIFIAQIGEKASRRALKIFNELRQEKFKLAENFAKDSLKVQMEIAHKLGVKLTLIIGQQEALDKTVIIRDMNTGNQEIVDQDKVAKELKKRLK